MNYDREEKRQEIVELSCRLARFGAVSSGAEVEHEGIASAHAFIVEFLREAGLNVISYDEGGIFPSVYCDVGLPGSDPTGDVLLSGHFDVVAPELPSQLHPVIDGDWLLGRGAADMLTVVATYMVFMRDLARARKGNGKPAPRIGLLLVSNEELGETDAWGTPHVFADLEDRFGYTPSFMIAGERTGEGAVEYGLIEVKNRGLVRVELTARGEATHSALVTTVPPVDRIFALQRTVHDAVGETDAFWRTSFQVPYMQGGTRGSLNVTATVAHAAFEMRTALAGDTERLSAVIGKRAEELGIETRFLNCDHAVDTPTDHIWVQRLAAAVSDVTGVEPAAVIGKGKLPGSQARFCPRNCVAVVWGQAGVGPHTSWEAHYIPSVLPYYDMLHRLIGR